MQLELEKKINENNNLIALVAMKDRKIEQQKKDFNQQQQEYEEKLQYEIAEKEYLQ